MNIQTVTKKAQIIITISLLMLVMGCAKSGYNEVMVYNNNFKSGYNLKNASSSCFLFFDSF